MQAWFWTDSTTIRRAARLIHRGQKASMVALGCALVIACGGGGSASPSVPAASPPPPGNPQPTVVSVSPANVVAGGAEFALTVSGSNFVPSSVVQWNGVARPTVFVSAGELRATIAAADIAVPTSSVVMVSSPPPGGGLSNRQTVEARWAKPTRSVNGFLVDVAADLGSRAALDAFVGPLFTAWNPTSAPGGGMKVMMFGAAPSACPPLVTGPLSSFADAVLIARGYGGNPSSVPTDLRFWPIPAASCGPAAAGLAGPNVVFVDGTSLWSGTSSLNQPNDLLRPYTSAGQTGTGVNARIIGTSVNFSPRQTVLPWALNGRARVGIAAEMTRLAVGRGPLLTQAKPALSPYFFNRACSSERPGFHCQLSYQFILAIAQSNITDWSAAPQDWRQPRFWLDPAQGGLPIVDTEILPLAGTLLRDRTSAVPLFWSRGSATLHSTYAPTQFDFEIEFQQFLNAVRVASALILGQPAGTDQACTQCAQVYGTRWNDSSAWELATLLYHSEIYDESGTSGELLGAFRWIYGGAAP